MSMQSLKEISVEQAKTQPEMVDQITEESPILAALKWTPSTHNGWNLAEVVKEIKGASFTDLNAPMGQMSYDSDLQYVSLFNLGGNLEAPQDKADMMGGKAKYFADKQALFLKDAGNTAERDLYYNYFLRAANMDGTSISAGGTAASSGETGLSEIVVMRLDQASNTGIYDPTQFKQGTLLSVTPLNGGNLYRFSNGVNGYGVQYKGRFGWQLLDPKRTVCAINNISKTKLPTLAMLDDAIANVHGKPGSTLVMANVKTLNMLFPSEKMKALHITNGEKSINTQVLDYNGIQIIGSYNVAYGNSAQV